MAKPQMIKSSSLGTTEPNVFDGDVIITGDVPSGTVIIVDDGSLEVRGNVGSGADLTADHDIVAEDIGTGATLLGRSITVRNVAYRAELHTINADTTATHHNIHIRGDVLMQCKLTSAGDIIIDGKTGTGIQLTYVGNNKSTVPGAQVPPHMPPPAPKMLEYKPDVEPYNPLIVYASDLKLDKLNYYNDNITIYGDVPAGVSVAAKGDILFEGGSMGNGCTFKATGDFGGTSISDHSTVRADEVFVSGVGRDADVTARGDVSVTGNVGAYAHITTHKDLTIDGTVARTANLECEGNFHGPDGTVVAGKQDLGFGVTYFPLKHKFLIPAKLISDSAHEDFVRVLAKVQEMSKNMQQLFKDGKTKDPAIELKPVVENAKDNYVCDMEILTHGRSHTEAAIKRDILAYTEPRIKASKGNSRQNQR